MRLIMVSCLLACVVSSNASAERTKPAVAGTPTDVDAVPKVSPLDAPPGGSTLRPLQVGDLFVYNARSFIRNGAGAEIEFAGELVQSVADAKLNPFGETCIIVTLSGRLEADVNGARQRVNYFEKDLFLQNSSGLSDCGKWDEKNNVAVFFVNRNGSERVIPNPINVGDVLAYTVSFDDSAWENCSEVVEGYDAIKTPAGTFPAYRMHETCEFSEQRTTDSRVWISPSNYIVRIESASKDHRLIIELESFEPATAP